MWIGNIFSLYLFVYDFHYVNKQIMCLISLDHLFQWNWMTKNVSYEKTTHSLSKWVTLKGFYIYYITIQLVYSKYEFSFMVFTVACCYTYITFITFLISVITPASFIRMSTYRFNAKYAQLCKCIFDTIKWAKHKVHHVLLLFLLFHWNYGEKL